MLHAMSHELDLTKREEMYDAEKECMDMITNLMIFHTLPVVQIGSGEGCLSRRFQKAVHAFRLDTADSFACAEVIMYNEDWIADMGVEKSLSEIEPVTVAKCIPWFQDPPSEEGQGPAKRQRVVEVEDDFLLPGPAAPAPTRRKVAVIDLNSATYTGGTMHQISNATKEVKDASRYWQWANIGTIAIFRIYCEPSQVGNNCRALLPPSGQSWICDGVEVVHDCSDDA